MDLDINQLSDLALEFSRKGKPLFVHGTMGIGKSYKIRDVAIKRAEEEGLEFNDQGIDEKKFNLVDIRISSLDPSDMRGIPYPDKEQEICKWLTPKWLPKGGKGIIFFDEINLAPQSIQAAAYQLINDRKMGDYILPSGWCVIAAGNRASDNAGVFSLSAPLNNRFGHCNLLVPTEEIWRDWALDNGIHPDIVSFVAFKPSLLYAFKKDNKSPAFPTPRTWEMASSMINDVKGTELMTNLVSSCVGEGAALEFAGFVKLKNKVNLADILKNPKKVKEITDIGLKYSMISGLSEKYKSDRKLMDPVLGVVEFMDPEFGVFLLRLMKGMNKSGFIKDLTGSKKWKGLASKYQKYLC